MLDDEDLREAETRSLTLQVALEDSRLLENYAALRNAIARARGVSLRQQMSRKSVAERMLSVQCEQLRVTLEKIIKTLGQLPDAHEQDAVAEYAAEVVALERAEAKKQAQADAARMADQEALNQKHR